MMLDISTNYHLDGLDGNSANITAQSSIKAAENADPIESNIARVTYDDLKGLSKSNMTVDTLTGLIVRNSKDAYCRKSGNKCSRVQHADAYGY